MYKKTDSIVQLFPSFEGKIEFLFQNDENIRDLCSDYLLCVSMILVRKNEINKSEKELAEFKDLLGNLKAEILNEIKAS
jgi:hypothetical protein